MFSKRWVVLILGLVGLFTLILAQTPTQLPETPGWHALLLATPIAYEAPLPEPVASPVDGTYAKLDPDWPQWWKCLRCADYRDAGGLWKLQFNQGVMRIYYDVTDWHSLASFVVSGDRLRLFNDPVCPSETGEYTWRLADGALQLTSHGDSCSFGLRASNLTQQAWQACTSGKEVEGCQQHQPPAAISPPPTLTVATFAGDSRFFATPPDVAVHSNVTQFPTPDGITVSFNPESIPYGVHRILWWDGPWIEATTDLPFTAVGVQFLGESPMGWARVLLDGAEVWNGETAALGFEKYRHGGYVEISGFGPGRHTLRVESLNFDFHPVTVASFGFSEKGGVRR